jgi:ribosomal-protein-alanine N-acetyltransferase
MSPQCHAAPTLLPMQAHHLDEVFALETALYPHPWSRNNFSDSLTVGYDMTVLLLQDRLIGYCVAMHGAAQEMHLLNLAVVASAQRQGHARCLLDALCRRAVAQDFLSLWLEVRLSNLRARQIYERYGFKTMGQRKAYYPLNAQQREDAIIMTLNLDEGIAA